MQESVVAVCPVRVYRVPKKECPLGTPPKENERATSVEWQRCWDCIMEQFDDVGKGIDDLTGSMERLSGKIERLLKQSLSGDLQMKP